jgi:hypothetical protein
MKQKQKSSTKKKNNKPRTSNVRKSRSQVVGNPKMKTSINVPVAKSYRKVGSSVDVRIREEEPFDYNYVQGVETSTTRYINPGNPNMFPWLSNFAMSFDKFTINNLSIRYQPVCPTTESGALYMAFDYDPKDTGNVSLDDVRQMDDLITSTVYTKNELLWRNRNNSLKQYFNNDNTGALTDTDLRTNYPGKLVIMMAATTSLGKPGLFYVSYDITLHVKQAIPTTLTSQTRCEGPPTKQAPFGSTQITSNGKGKLFNWTGNAVQLATSFYGQIAFSIYHNNIMYTLWDTVRIQIWTPGLVTEVTYIYLEQVQRTAIDSPATLMTVTAQVKNQTRIPRGYVIKIDLSQYTPGLTNAMIYTYLSFINVKPSEAIPPL